MRRREVSAVARVWGGTSALRDTLVLKDGTALRKCYFGECRFSEDLDFSALPGVPRGDSLAEAVSAACQTAVRLLDPHARVIVEIRVDEPILRPAQRQRVIHGYGEPLEAEVAVYALEEVVAEKLRAILQQTRRLEQRGWSRSRACPTPKFPAGRVSVL